MVIIAEKSRGQEVNFSNQSIKFDENGAAEVEDSVGQEIITKYPWIKSKEQFLEAKKKISEPKVIVDVLKVQTLEVKLLDEKNKNIKLEAELANQKDIVEAWKAKYTSVEKKLEAFNVLTADKEESASEDKLDAKVEDTSNEDLRSQLEGKTKEELREIAAEMGFTPGGRSSEETIIETILEKANA